MINDVCPKCGKEGCTCGPECECTPEGAQADITEQQRNKKPTPKLPIDFEQLMAKLCAKGKAAAKRKFKVYPSAYANIYASGVCSGRIKPGKKKNKKKK